MGSLVAATLHSLAVHSSVRLFSWRDGKHEVDLVLDHPEAPLAFEIGSSADHHRTGLAALIKRHRRLRGRCCLVTPHAPLIHPGQSMSEVGTLFLVACARQAEAALPPIPGRSGIALPILESVGQDLSSVLIVAVAEYADSAKNRPQVATAAEAFGALFNGSSHATVHAALVGGPTRETILDSLQTWGNAQRPSTGLLLWTGHCELNDARQPRLLTGRSGEVVYANALAAQIAEAAFERWVVVVDACWAHRVLQIVTTELNDKVGVKPDLGFVVLSSVDALDEADAGLFTGALAAVLREGPAQRWWSRRQQFLDLDPVLRRLEQYLEQHHPTVGPPVPSIGGSQGLRCFPNPLYVETAVAEALDEAHFLPKAAGIEAGETGWFFTGRVDALRRIRAWLRRADDPLLVVTGSAGTGKSAILGRVITLSVPAYRVQAEDAGVLAGAPEGTVPDLGDVQVAFHARERDVTDLLGFLAEQLDVPAAREVTELFAPIEARAAAREGGFTVVLDALDEAFGGHGRRMIDEIVMPLTRRPGVKFLIGARPGVADWDLPGDRVVNLDHAPNMRADLREYARQRLSRVDHSTYRTEPDLAAAVARGVAEVSGTSFLIARVITKTLASSPVLDVARPGWETALPRGLDAAFEADLAAYGARHGQEVERLLRDLLEALAWDEGQGIPRRLIPPMARAVPGRSYQDDDVTTLLSLAGGHVTEAQIDGWAVYRLYHEQFRAHLRKVTLAGGVEAAQVHARITDALLEVGRADGWSSPDPYLRRILPRHAKLGARLDDLALEPGYLESADPDALLAILPLTGGTDPAAPIMRTYRRAAHTLDPLRPTERTLALDIAEAAAVEPRPTTRLPSQVRWRRGPTAMELQTLTGHTGAVLAVAFGVIDGDPVIVSGGRDGTVRLWDARTGQARGQPLTAHIGGAEAVAFGVIDGDPVIVSGGEDATVRLWDARTSRTRSGPLTGHTDRVSAVAFGLIDQDPVIISGGWDGTVQLWDARTSQSRGGPLTGHASVVVTVAFGVVDQRPVIISGDGGDGTVRVWDARTGQSRGGPFTGHTGVIGAVVFGVIDEDPVTVSGGGDATVRVWDARTGQARGQPLTGHTGWVAAVVFGLIDKDPVIISGGDDGTVRLWNAHTGQARGEPLTSRISPVGAVAVGVVDQDPVIVSSCARWDGKGRVRVWDARTGRRRRRPLTDHAGWVGPVAVGVVDGGTVIVSRRYGRVWVWDARTGRRRRRLTDHAGWVGALAMGVVNADPVIVSGGGDATVRVWDARTGQARGQPLTGHTGGVAAVVLGAIDGDPVIVSGSRDGTVRLWDARTGSLMSVIPAFARVNAVVIVPGGVAIAAGFWVLVVDVPGLQPQPSLLDAAGRGRRMRFLGQGWRRRPRGRG